MRASALAQHVEAAAVGTLDSPLLAQIEVDFGMPQRATAAVAGDAVGIDDDGFERLGHYLTPAYPADHSRRLPPGHARRMRAHGHSGLRARRRAPPRGRPL